MMPPDDIYKEDLAKIHIDGYGFHWEGAASAVPRFSRDNGVDAGAVVDLGCGGGQWLERISREGHTVCGVDRSPSKIKAAKKRVPNGKFILGSFADVRLTPCDAVTSLGEPINNLAGHHSIRRTFMNVFQALRPGGVFIFDAIPLERQAGHVGVRTHRDFHHRFIGRSMVTSRPSVAVGLVGDAIGRATLAWPRSCRPHQASASSIDH
jgi:SAM-dependent methyltransferase